MVGDSTDEQPSAKMLECSHCPKAFRYNSERIRHEMSHSPGFECDICSKKFSFVSALRRHQKQHERTGSVKCEECNRKFRDEVLLKRHVKYAHKGTFTCTKCSAILSSDQALHMHMKTHRPESERRFKCSFQGCGKSFNFSHHLKHHELTHTNAKQHFCSVCGKGFIQSHHLKTHLKTHDPSEWLYCDFPGCKKKFSTEYAKKRHLTTHKMKPDSGISSDSNSCDAPASQEYAEDFILCASCGESVYQSDILGHSTKCQDFLDISANIESCTIGPIKDENIFDNTILTARRTFEISPIKEENNFEQVEITVKIDKDASGCNNALGGCIMGANNCVCTQMSKPIDENYDFTPIGESENATFENNNIVERNNNIDFIDSYPEVVLNFFDGKDNEAVLKTDSVAKSVPLTSKSYVIINMCEECDCASTCTRDPANCNGSKNPIVKDTPNVHTIEGVVKIKDTFDIDIPTKLENVIKAGSDGSDKFVPFSTCRDVIGNCIVGGNEGCLCARMMIDEQQAMAQEIDDITPVPKTEKYS